MQTRSYSMLAIGIFLFIIGLVLFFPTQSKHPETPLASQAQNNAEDTSLAGHDITPTRLYKSSTALLSPLPEAPADSIPESEITLWESLRDAKTIELDGVPALRFQVDASKLEHLSMGQKIHAATPHGNGQITAELSSTRNQLSNVEVWSGKIEGGNASDMLIVTRGKLETHVVITTSDGIVTTIINNKTGQASLIDEADYISNQLPIDDGITVDPIDDTPPAHLTQLSEFSVGHVPGNKGAVR